MQISLSQYSHPAKVSIKNFSFVSKYQFPGYGVLSGAFLIRVCDLADYCMYITINIHSACTLHR